MSTKYDEWKRRAPIIILFLAAVSTASCEPPMPPAEEEMIRHFNMHEARFDQICEIIANNSEGSFHYPPHSSGNILLLDSAGQISYTPHQRQDIPVHGLLKPGRIRPKSLLAKTECDLILVNGRKQETSDSVSASLVMPYCSHGIVDAGTSKSFVYNPGLRSRRNIHISEHGDLNEIYRRTITTPRCTSHQRELVHPIRPFGIAPDSGCRYNHKRMKILYSPIQERA